MKSVGRPYDCPMEPKDRDYNHFYPIVGISSLTCGLEYP